jgi:hypothetical protein
MTVNGLRCEMSDFKRTLSPELIDALKKLAYPKAPPNWWKDVLANKDLLLAVRGGYLNAYVKGRASSGSAPALMAASHTSRSTTSI